MTVRYDVRDGVGVVTLDRPEKLNALNEEMREGIADACDAAGRDPAVRAVLLQASGKTFCASGDASTMGDFTPTTGRDRLKLAHRMIRSVANVEKPVVAAVRGAVAGIGWSLALACDMIVASDTARFSQVFRNVGLVPDGGAVYFLTQHLGVLRAKELVYSGRRMEPAEALSLGLVNRVVPDGDLEAAAWQEAQALAQGPTFAFGVAKKMFKLMYQPDLETVLDAEAWAQGIALMTDDHREGVRAFFDKRKPQFKGS